MTEIAARLARPVHRLGFASKVAIVFAVVLVLGAAAVSARALTLRDSVLPGVAVAGVDVGGLGRADARGRIEREIGARLSQPVEVAIGDGTVTAHPRSLFVLDAVATEAKAFAAGRGSVASRFGAIAFPFLVTHDVAPVLGVREKARAAFAEDVRALLERPQAARLERRGLAAVVIPARTGTRVDEAALVEAVRDAALHGRPVVEATVLDRAPAVTTAEAEAVAAQAQAVLSAPVWLRARGETIGRLGPRRLAEMLVFRRTAGTYEVALDEKALARRLVPSAAPFARKPVDARFRIDGKRVRVVRAKPGAALAADKTAAAILRAAAATGGGDRVARIAFETVAPDFTTREAKALGIRHEVSTFTTLMGESSANRIWNVQLLGRYLDGTIIKPGAVFSYNKVMGPRTAERGFREGQMIWNGVLVPSIGGGVCQTATTIFNAAFEAGLPIRERRNHSFYISHYPMGRDATVSWGGSDLVFKNDLDHAILIKAHGDAETFTVTFYGTRQGRRVVSTTSTPTNYTQPRLQYAIDPSAPPGSVRTSEGGGPGFHVTVHRKVYERGRLIREDDFATTYTPQNPTRIYGPGATPPGPYFYLPSSP